MPYYATNVTLECANGFSERFWPKRCWTNKVWPGKYVCEPLVCIWNVWKAMLEISVDICLCVYTIQNNVESFSSGKSQFGPYNWTNSFSMIQIDQYLNESRSQQLQHQNNGNFFHFTFYRAKWIVYNKKNNFNAIHVNLAFSVVTKERPDEQQVNMTDISNFLLTCLLLAVSFCLLSYSLLIIIKQYNKKSFGIGQMA